MEEHRFYFVKNSFYIDFPDPFLMKNKEMANGKPHNRPCFFSIADKENQGIYWLVPISHRVDKYIPIYDKKRRRYGKCNTICFGNVLGSQKAFLIQNMFPITENYIESIYIMSAEQAEKPHGC